MTLSGNVRGSAAGETYRSCCGWERGAPQAKNIVKIWNEGAPQAKKIYDIGNVSGSAADKKYM